MPEHGRDECLAVGAGMAESPALQIADRANAVGAEQLEAAAMDAAEAYQRLAHVQLEQQAQWVGRVEVGAPGRYRAEAVEIADQCVLDVVEAFCAQQLRAYPHRARIGHVSRKSRQPDSPRLWRRLRGRPAHAEQSQPGRSAASSLRESPLDASIMPP